ncbi:MAG: NTP transferase domain-containing protein [Bacteroidia bacterium]|jgi:molybdopterin-guanine dinucleotide biosynthesis protein A/nucleoside-triphosphatase THEP1|nr:NTP transferase domain-containing protein [Bacteroidia bacterium]
MKRKSNIYILSEPIQSGKTTLLMDWCTKQTSIAGILTPDVNGARMLYDIHSKRYFPFQLSANETGINIGRFIFSEQSFNHARIIIEEAITQENNWIVLDEIGRLEIDQFSGFEPQVTQTIKQFQKHSGSTQLLLVIRDYLLLQAIQHYQLHDAIVIDKLFLQTTLAPLSGLVLCGGQSVRMGKDKAWIVYHQLPQFAHVYAMMQSCCPKVFVSCNSAQIIEISKTHSCIEDNATFINNGPFTGLLSAFTAHPNQAFLVLGCDYPNFNMADMKALISARSIEYDAVCYINSQSGFTEPLLAVYEPSCSEALFKFWESGGSSLNQFLTTIRTKVIHAQHEQNLKSYDTPSTI